MTTVEREGDDELRQVGKAGTPLKAPCFRWDESLLLQKVGLISFLPSHPYISKLHSVQTFDSVLAAR